MADYLLVIGDREALGWLLTEQRMAFPGLNRAEVRALAPGDSLFLYTTRGCFKNPTRDRGRVIAAGTATTPVAALDDPVDLGGRRFPVGCDVRFPSATAWPDGVDLGELVAELDAFAGVGDAWSIKLRRPLVGLTPRDAELLRRRLDALHPQPLGDVIEPYSRWWQPTVS
ncbi:hypothetical protein ACFS2C_10280 [Prauserella oleivorans]|uniref:EVE domain-containing protein n=1 Tax=Prauserella oleivorans TaxID=1478153 RepID=A0ABW5WB02_9PSEU